MLRYVAGRVASLTMSLIALSVVVFALMHSVPGGPFTFEKQMPEAAMQNILHKYGLDRPLHEQYLNWVWAMLQGDFGIPFQSPTETVTQVIARAWPVTMQVGVVTLTVAFGVGLLLGTIAAFNQNSWVDSLVTFGATLGMTVPSFVIGFTLIFVFAVELGWLPTGGWGEPRHLIMPVIAYSLAPMAVIARTTRTNMLEVIRSDYVRLARARGIPPRLIALRYVLKNASIPMITVLLPEIPNVLTGSIFVETVFAVPGLGRFFTTSALQRDYPMIMACMMLVIIVWGITFLVTDVLYTVIDPRVRLTEARA
ncbi:MAG TPA: ABC transporter permease [Chloroflexota bacterium]|nr:ABC transporter permease [Chloroflexota bacterium]